MSGGITSVNHEAAIGLSAIDSALRTRVNIHLSSNPSALRTRVNIYLFVTPPSDLTCMQHALELSPEWFEGYYNLGNVLAEMGPEMESAALDAYQQALRVDPHEVCVGYTVYYA